MLDECSPNDILLICGSLYIMNEVRYAMGIREPQDVIYDYHCRDHGPESVAAGKAQYIYPHEKPLEWNFSVCLNTFRYIFLSHLKKWGGLNLERMAHLFISFAFCCSFCLAIAS